MDVKKLYEDWLINARDEWVVSELKKMAGDENAVIDAFFKPLKFGTGGLRGKLGAGVNRMNVYTVARATLGLADHVNECGRDKSVVIAYDSRNMSKEFAHLAADVLSSKKIKVFLFDRLMPTPVLSYAVRHFKAGAGIVVTASHNPKEYNGYKVYNEHGCQITDAAAKAVLDRIETYGYFNDYTPDRSLIELVGEELLDRFIGDVCASSVGFDKRYLPKIIYTPLNGTGRLPVKKLFEKLGVDNYVVVPEQEYPDGNFTTCPYPNPEEPAALAVAVGLAKKSGGGIVVATDPDADRMGVAVVDENGVRYFNGNETGVLMENFLLLKLRENGTMPDSPYIVKTIVTTPLAEKVAESFNVGHKSVLTGFKYIGETIDRCAGENFVFGMEESYGYLTGTHARDKDAVSAVMTFVEAACHYAENGLTLSDALDGIYKKYGYYRSALYYKTFEGPAGMRYMADLMLRIRSAPPRAICGHDVKDVIDYSLGVDGLPKSDVVGIVGDGFRVIVRPSGTEPKIKIYVSVFAGDEYAAEEMTRSFVGWAKETVG